MHLRFGKVARGGLRWSDRREDFRTEILGLVKAQMVKNAVIVPTGSKGGFFPKALPDPAVDRDAWLAEGSRHTASSSRGCSTSPTTASRADRPAGPGWSGTTRTTPPRRRRRQGHRDLLRLRQRQVAGVWFWLDDAFVRWLRRLRPQDDGTTCPRRVESVKRHFREMGIDTQSEDFTVVGVGDMSGDVFGNGMLLSSTSG